jgi:hypothetical protein
MFENPHIIQVIAKQRHEELLAECEQIRKIKGAINFVPVEKRGAGRIMLPIADLFIAIGVALRRRWGVAAEGAGEADGKGFAPE